MRQLVILGSLGLGLLAADKPIELPENIRQIVDLARTAPPELAADTLLRLVESGKVPSVDAQSELLQEAFLTAGRAQLAAPMRTGDAAVPRDASVYQAKAFSLGYDALSLRTRALASLWKVDPKKAGDLFPQLQKPAVACSCSDDLVADLSPWFHAVADYLAYGLTPQERRSEEPVRFVLGAIQSITSAPGMEAAGILIARVELTPVQQAAVSASYAGRLDSLSVDDRSFVATIERIASNVESLAGKSPSSVAALRIALRSYLVRQLSGSRCAAGGRSEQAVRQAVDWFNTEFRGEAPAITEGEMKASKFAKPPKDAADREQDAKSGRMEIASATMNLLFKDGKLRPVADRLNADWRGDVDAVFAKMDAWRPDSLLSFHEKALNYRSLANSLPIGENKDKALRETVLFLASADAARESFAEWMWQVRETEDNAADRSALRSLYLASGNVAMMVYTGVAGITGAAR